MPARQTPVMIAANAGMAGLGMFSLYAMHEMLGSTASTVVASIGSSAVLLYCAPSAPFSQPRNVIGGHFFSCSAGIIVRQLPFISDHAMLLGPCALGCAILVMQASNTIHPPAGATAILATTSPLEAFFLVPVWYGSVSIVSTAIVLNHLVPGRRYPEYW